MAEALEEVDTLTTQQSIHMVVSSPGSYLFEIENAQGKKKSKFLEKKIFLDFFWIFFRIFF